MNLENVVVMATRSQHFTHARLQALANEIRVAGRKEPVEDTKPARNGGTPNLVDIHSAVLSGNITEEEGRNLSPKYTPNKVMSKAAGKTRTQAQAIESTINNHKFYKKGAE